MAYPMSKPVIQHDQRLTACLVEHTVGRCDAMSAFSVVGSLTSTVPDSCSFGGVSLKLYRKSGISLAAASNEISVDVSLWHCLLHCLQSSRSIFAACQSVQCMLPCF